MFPKDFFLCIPGKFCFAWVLEGTMRMLNLMCVYVRWKKGLLDGEETFMVWLSYMFHGWWFDLFFEWILEKISWKFYMCICIQNESARLFSFLLEILWRASGNMREIKHFVDILYPIGHMSNPWYCYLHEINVAQVKHRKRHPYRQGDNPIIEVKLTQVIHDVTLPRSNRRKIQVRHISYGVYMFSWWIFREKSRRRNKNPVFFFRREFDTSRTQGLSRLGLLITRTCCTFKMHRTKRNWLFAPLLQP